MKDPLSIASVKTLAVLIVIVLVLYGVASSVTYNDPGYLLRGILEAVGVVLVAYLLISRP